MQIQSQGTISNPSFLVLNSQEVCLWISSTQFDQWGK